MAQRDGALAVPILLPIQILGCALIYLMEMQPEMTRYAGEEVNNRVCFPFIRRRLLMNTDIGAVD